MSRIGRRPIAVPKGVTVALQGGRVAAKGPKGELSLPIPSGIEVGMAEGSVDVKALRDDASCRALHGTTRSLIANMVKGVESGYTKDLQIQGVGFRAQLQGQKLVLSLGYSHPIEFAVPPGITVQVADGTSMSVSGADKHMVGEVSARLRSFFPAEPYKGKGVRYKGEHVRRKAGKAVA
jgi:large subunit ribosomal protein L6